MEYSINLNSLKVTNAIAGVINGAFETGINPAWFQVESLSKDGFLDAAFADGDLTTPSGQPAKINWTLKVRLNYDSYKSKWVTLTPSLAVEQWIKLAKDKNSEFLRTRADAYLRYLVALSNDDADLAETILFDQYEPDGVHDDALAQQAIAGEVVFG
jgi:hypothetical protein